MTREENGSQISKSQRTRRKPELGFSRRKHQRLLANSDDLWVGEEGQAGPEASIGLSLSPSKTHMMPRNCDLSLNSDNHSSLIVCSLQRLMIITWCWGQTIFRFFLPNIIVVYECILSYNNGVKSFLRLLYRCWDHANVLWHFLVSSADFSTLGNLILEKQSWCGVTWSNGEGILVQTQLWR